MHELATTKHTPIAGSRFSWDDIKTELARFIPEMMPADKLLKWAFFLVQQNPRLTECTSESFITCLLKAHSLGLDPTVKNSCWLIPRNNSKKDGNGRWYKVQEVTFQTGYGGMRAMAMRSGSYRNVVARVVHENDDFAVELSGGEMHHHPCLKGDPGEIYCAYSVAIDVDGHKDPEVMTVAQINKVRERSGGGPAWENDWPEMARKTVLKRHCKRLDMPTEARHVLDAEDVYEPVAAIASAAPAKPPVNFEALPKIQRPAALPEPAPVDEAVEVPKHELGNVPKLGPTTISKCTQRGILTERQLYDAIAAGKKPSGIRSVSVDYLLAKFGGEQVSEPTTDAPQEGADAPETPPVDDAAAPVSQLMIKLEAGLNAGILPVDIIHGSLIDAGMEARAADALIGTVVAERALNWSAATNLDIAKLWRVCLNKAM